MPFKLRLKKSRQYNVVSKSLFVICVELLDSTNIECTLSAESSGQECLDNVCQRLGLQQPEFFGLRYIARNGPPHQRWVEMDRPLKRQIDKHAREPNLLLRVMYYVTGVHLLTDEMTRYHYFLQLKMDVIEGRSVCDANQAILLASYSMQAEFGNHDMERHTAEYLKDFVLFPKHLTEQGHLERLTEAVIHQHAALAGLAQGTAEEFYILAAQKLEGYGQEHFVAKDARGQDVVLGISLSGILINGSDGHQPTVKFYPWKNITNVISHKRSFGIEGQPPETGCEFQLSEAECAKYIWRLCVYQHTFFAQNEQALSALETSPSGDCGDPLLPLSTHRPLFQTDSQNLDSCDELDIATGNSANVSPLPNSNKSVPPSHLAGPSALTSNSISNVTTASASAAALQQQRAQSTSCLDLASTSTTSAHLDKLRALLPSYRSAPDYETAMQLKYRASSQAAAAAAAAAAAGMYLYSSQPEIHQAHARENVNSYTHYKPYPDVTRISQHVYEEGQPVADTAMHNYRRDLEAAGLDQQLIQSLQLVQVYKPPPPYPIGRPSSSTPDLASQTLGPPMPTCFNPHVSGSSPDLVSSRSLGIQARRHLEPHHQHQQLLPNPEAHRTYANLAAVAETEISRYPASGTIGASNATQSGLLYSYPMLSGHALLSRSNRNPHQEPIYENVPLPWQAVEAVRSRASSIQSAPERTNPPQPAPPQRRKSHTAATTELATATSTVTTTSSTSTIINELPVDVPPAQQTPMPSVVTVSLTPAVTSNNEHQMNTTLASTSSSNSSSSGKNKIRKKFAMLMGGGKNSKDKNRKDNQAADELQHKWSTGLPRMPLPPNISKENMCQLLERKLVDSQLFFEFEKIPKKKPNADFSTALLPENINRNRFKELLPYEENRVRLTPNKENRTGYINASHITATIGSQAKFYIAAQGPLASTVNSFWQMIWEADVYLVVMLTGLHDDEMTTSYFPVIGDRCLQVGEFQIWRQFSQETGHCVTSKLRVFHTIARRSRGVWHLRYGEWGDQGCPHSVGHFLGFLEELNSVRQQAAVEVPAGHNGNPPMLVHCSAGVGRTGVVILGDLLLYTLDHNQELDVPRVVTQLRQQRMLMVQTVAQYRFVYSLLIYYLKHSRLI